MSRLLSTKDCEITFDDKISGSEITLSYRMPTTKENIDYTNAIVVRKGKKIKSIIGATRQKYGAAILRGFADGAFANEDGPISSNPESPRYVADWKDQVAKFAPDIIEALAVHVFEQSLETQELDEDVEADEEPVNP